MMLERPNYINPWAPERWSAVEAGTQPLVTIGVLNYNRKNELRATLDCLTKGIEYSSLELLVVDNASGDGSKEMVEQEFKDVTVFALKENIATAGRNVFYKNATGKYIFSYDDDSFPATPSTISEVVAFLEANSRIAAISFFCFQPITGFAESGELEKFGFSGSVEEGFEGLYFVEGGMCIRRDAFAAIEGYDPEFRWGAEGADLTLQLYKAGKVTMYHPGFATLHMKSQTNRNHSKNVELFTRNYLWTIAKHFPFYAAVILSAGYVFRKMITMVLHPALAGGCSRGITAGLAGFFRQRRKTSKLNLRQVLGLKRWYLFLYRW